MTRDEALAKAVATFTEGTVSVGTNWSRPLAELCQVGSKVMGRWRWRGRGETWEKAFENVVENPDGPAPPGEGRR